MRRNANRFPHGSSFARRGGPPRWLATPARAPRARKRLTSRASPLADTSAAAYIVLTAKTILAPTSERRADRTPLLAVAGDRCAELGKALADYEFTLRCELTANDLRAARATLDKEKWPGEIGQPCR